MAEARRPAGAGDELRLLFFRSAGERFVLDVAYVREIMPHPAVTPVPFVPRTVAGVINHRGAVYTLIRFAPLVGLGEDPEGSVALLRLPDMTVGLAVASIEGIERVPGRLLRPVAGGAPGAVPFLRRATDHTGRPVLTIDAELLIDAIYRLPTTARAGEPALEAAHG